MPIYKRCSRCGSRLPSGTKCECAKNAEKQRQREYDLNKRDKKADQFYHSDEWGLAREDTIAYYAGIDIYSYYVLNSIEYGSIVHHIIPLKDDWSKRSDKSNLIYLTDINHGLIHKAMRNGEYVETINLLCKLVERYRLEFKE